MKNIKYTELKTQEYIVSPLFNDKEVSLLFALRSECVRECKANFKSSFKNSQEIFCKICTEKKIDNQPHVLECKVLSKSLKSEELEISYEDIFHDTKTQKNVTVLFMKLLQLKSTLNEKEDYPSTLQSLNCEVLKNGYNLQTLYC